MLKLIAKTHQATIVERKVKKQVVREVKLLDPEGKLVGPEMPISADTNVEESMDTLITRWAKKIYDENERAKELKLRFQKTGAKFEITLKYLA